MGPRPVSPDLLEDALGVHDVLRRLCEQRQQVELLRLQVHGLPIDLDQATRYIDRDVTDVDRAFVADEGEDASMT
ncbi:MAG TPA: hypothetical protein VM143_17270 [Acidimicrobiales bacterium]|nr:hypothetical protein [Acidimicrobiales bacterium]